MEQRRERHRAEAESKENADGDDPYRDPAARRNLDGDEVRSERNRRWGKLVHHPILGRVL